MQTHVRYASQKREREEIKFVHLNFSLSFRTMKQIKTARVDTQYVMHVELSNIAVPLFENLKILIKFKNRL